MRSFRNSPLLVASVLLAVPSSISACSHSSAGGPSASRVVGQTAYESAPLPGSGGRNGSFAGGGASAGASGAAGSSGGSSSSGAGAPTSGGTTSTAPSRQVQETDIYRLDGNRLYYLNSYRGLMIFDVTDVDHPALVGRAPIFGDPQEMIVNAGIAVVVVGDWYGIHGGLPFHGSIARGFDCTDPANIKNVGDAYLGGWVQDTRVVGNVLYTVAQDYGWQYGWGYAGGGVVSSSTTRGPNVSVASVSFAGGVVAKVGEETFGGNGGVFNVTPNAIVLASQHISDPNNPYGGPALTDLRYIDISDPAGTIRLRGTITIDSSVSGWGPDNGRWNLDFADNVHAHTIGCANQYCGSSDDAYALTTVDFSNPDTPVITSTLPIAGLGWSAAARFDVDPAGAYARMYLSPSNNYSTTAGTTPLSIYDLSNPQAPALAGATSLDGNIWLFIPNGRQIFALGNSYGAGSDPTLVEVQYVDVSNPTAPTRLGASKFGSGWSWSPAADTFKAFVVNATQGLAVVPFSGWDNDVSQYANGVQLIGFTNTALTTSGTARTRGWVERGIFVKNRLMSLSDQALAVIDYSNPAAPSVVSEMTLARNVVSAVPQGATIAELSSDWYGNDVTSSEMRVLPIANAAETTDNGQAASVSIKGVDAQSFQNGTLSYVVTNVQVPMPCGTGGQPYPYPTNKNGQCFAYTQQVQVVDTSGGGAKLRGSVTLPVLPPWYYGGYAWGGFYYYDWYNGADTVQVGGDALAMRRWYPYYYGDGAPAYWDDADSLFVVDLENPDKPVIASMAVTRDPTAWWGNMMAIGNTLYTSHYEWTEAYDANAAPGTVYSARYYLDQIDLSDRAHPRIGRSVNVPGTLVGASTRDPSVLYFADYRWSDTNETDEIAVCRLSGSVCSLESVTPLDGYVGNVIVQNDKAYMTVQEYEWMAYSGGAYTPPYVELHQLDLSNPSAPKDRVATNRKDGWGWLLGVQGDRAIVNSGWGPMGVDIYKLSDTAPPAFEESVRALGWDTYAITRQGNTLFLASGYWGVQPIVLP